MDKKALLEDSEVFCILPWIHMHVWPNGNAMPCCIADSFDPFGNVNEFSMNEIWNNERYKELRLAMLNNKKAKSCKRCYYLEDNTSTWTLRKSHNLSYGDKYFHLVEQTQEDGSILEENMGMRYMDIRFSNICNMKCRSCGPELSSQWATEYTELYGKHELANVLKNDGTPVVNVAKNVQFWNDIEKYLPLVEEVYWAGGEPLITNEHYKILDYWIKNNQQVRLRYNTNFSNLDYKKKSAIEYWKFFEDVHVSASLDTYGKRAEYMRHGTNWDTIESNRMRMIEEVPNVKFELTPTISLYNVWSWPDLHMDWVDRGLLGLEDCRLNILTYPLMMRYDNAPENFKIQVRNKYIDYKEWLIKNNASLSFLSKVQEVIQILNTGDINEERLRHFLSLTQNLDNVRQENVWEVFNELGWLSEYTNDLHKFSKKYSPYDY